MNNRSLLEVAEYISLISSVAGSFAAMVSGQVAFATLPLSVSILLNLVNRYRFEQQTRQSTNAVISQSHQQILTDIQSLRSVLNQSAKVDLNTVQQTLFKLKEEIAAVETKLDRLASLSAFDPNSIIEGISQLTNQYTILSKSLNAVRQQLDNLPLLERIDSLQSSVFQLSEEIAAQKTEIESILSHETFNIELIKSNISQITEQCTALQEFLDALVYRMLSDGGISSRVCSDEMETRLSKIVEYYRQQRQKRQKYATSPEPQDESSV